MNKQHFQLLQAVGMAEFAALEAAMYLDNHPDCPEAADYMKEMRRKANEARRAYEENVGPLTLKAAAESTPDEYWNWLKGPWPWQGGMC